MTAKKTQIKLYKIDVGIFTGMSTADIPSEIVNRANEGISSADKRFIPQQRNDDLEIPEGFTFEVFHALKDGTPGWVEAWTDALAEDADMLHKKNTMSSFMAFISHHNSLYVLTGGQGNFAISNYIENFFGLDVIDHLIDSTLSRGLGEASKSGMTGTVKTEQRTFYDLTDALSQDSFETFFRNLRSKIDPTVVKEYFEEFYPKQDYDSFFQGGNYFLLRKSISITSVFNLVLSIERIFAERTPSGHNKLIPIGSVGSSIDHVKALNDALRKDIFDNQNNPDVLDNYYLAPKAIPAYLVDSSIFAIGERVNRISPDYGDIPKVSEYIEVLLNIGGQRRLFTDENSLRDAINSYKVFWKHNEEDTFRAIDVFKSINGVMDYNRKSYLRFEGFWYEIRQNFKDIINSEFSKYALESGLVIDAPNHLDAWEDGNDEDDYNFSYVDDNNEIMVAHKVMKQDAADSEMDRYIEYADLIRLDVSQPELIHVKKTCNGEMRVASAQVLMCAQKMNQNKTEAFFREYYQLIMARNHTASQSTKISEDDFVQLGMNENLKICLALSDDRVVEDAPGMSLAGKFFFVKMFKDIEKMGLGRHFYVYNV